MCSVSGRYALDQRVRKDRKRAYEIPFISVHVLAVARVIALFSRLRSLADDRFDPVWPRNGAALACSMALAVRHSTIE